tara:strand:+ start:39455 stop:40246 length:792 start_codon:yes stop_codon:yes gene_type:complete
MKPGITQLCLSRQNLNHDLSKARNMGYEAIELVFSDEGFPNIDAPLSEITSIKDACLANNLELSSMIAIRQDPGSLLSPDLDERNKRVAILKRGFEIAEILNVEALLLHPGQLDPRSCYQTTWNNIRDILAKLAPEAQSRGTQIAIENVWNQFMLSPREACQLVDEISSSSVGIYLDTANMILYGYPDMWIRELGNRILRVHVKDFRRRDGSWVQLMEGDTDWLSVMTELRKIGYNAPLVSEVGGNDKKMLETVDRIHQIIAL